MEGLHSNLMVKIITVMNFYFCCSHVPKSFSDRPSGVLRFLSARLLIILLLSLFSDGSLQASKAKLRPNL